MLFLLLVLLIDSLFLFITYIDSSYNDLGQNVARDNAVCNGLWIDGRGRCYAFQSSSNPSPASEPVNIPTATTSSTTIITTAPRGGVGYFNYDIDDNKYGPNNDGWGNVRDNPEHLRYEELSSTLRRSLINKCNWKNIHQSPIDLCENKINNDCDEYHQTRTHVSTSSV